MMIIRGETEKPTKATNEVPFLKKTSAPALGSLSSLGNAQKLIIFFILVGYCRCYTGSMQSYSSPADQVQVWLICSSNIQGGRRQPTVGRRTLPSSSDQPLDLSFLVGELWPTCVSGFDMGQLVSNCQQLAFPRRSSHAEAEAEPSCRNRPTFLAMSTKQYVALLLMKS